MLAQWQPAAKAPALSPTTCRPPSLRDREIAIHGSKQFVIDKIMKMRKECGYDDFCFLGWFELGGFEAQEIEEQMQIFSEEVMPVITSECGGKVELPARGFNLVA
jgi:hypothetical protein